MKVIVAVTVILILTMSSSVLWGKDASQASLNFNVKKSAKLHCNIRQSSRGPWLLSVVAEDSNDHPIFNYLYSVRKKFKLSMQDCNDWMKAVKEQNHSSGAKDVAHINDHDSAKTKRKAGK